MRLDCHIHIMDGEKNREEFIRKLQDVGIDGGVLLSLPPASFTKFGKSHSAEERLADLFYWTGDHPDLYPFFWIDPLESDAVEQVETANKYGVKGFKVICNKFYPSDKRPLEVFKAIAESNKPILFHSGILWDGSASSKYNRPAEFEALLDISGLRFALAHVSWPWCDECIAVYGKFQDALAARPDLNVEMFIDTTPGTPPIYREEVLTKLLTVGYDISNNILFGTDCTASNFSCKYAGEIIARDSSIYKKLNIEKEDNEKIFSENLKRFIGV